MKLTEDLEIRIENDIMNLQNSDFHELKKLFHIDNKGFVTFVNKYLSRLKKKEDIDKFCFFFNGLKNEILDVSPFLSININKIFVIMIKNNFYKQVAEYSFLLENCANIKTLQLLDEFIKNKIVSKYLTTVEIYRIKKLVFELSNKFKKNDIAYKIQLELENEDLHWLDDIDK